MESAKRELNTPQGFRKGYQKPEEKKPARIRTYTDDYSPSLLQDG